MRAIIIGSGPAGLTTAHCFLRAGINDITILEQRDDPVYQGGAALGLWPQTLRIMDQLGLLEELEKIGAPLHRSLHIKSNGKVYNKGDFFDLVEQNHGYPTLLMGRGQFVKMLYDRLPDAKTRIHPGKKVTTVEEDESRVHVRCQDGSVFTGDIVVGCDGVHSVARKMVGQGGTAQEPVSEIRCMFGNSPRLEGLPANDMTELHDTGLCFQILSTPDRAYWLFYTLKEKGEPKCKRYSAEEREALAEKYATRPVSIGTKVTFGDLWKTKASATLYDLEEICAEKWSKGRVVIVGDSAHKMTSNLALGCNSAIESAVTLTNQLHVLLQESKDKPPSPDALERAFSQYQKLRHSRARAAVSMSASYARGAVWATPLAYFVSRFLIPLVSMRRIADGFSDPLVREAQALDFVDANPGRTGKMSWKYAAQGSQ